MTGPDKVTRPLLRYFGAKWRLASWIISHFPDHQLYCEPFGGSAGVLLRKPISSFEVYNDLDGDVVNFFRCLRDHPKELQRLIDLTPYSREEYEAAFQSRGGEPLERARRYFVLAWQGYGGPRRTSVTGWKVQRRTWDSSRADQLCEWNAAKDLSAGIRRFMDVQIENDKALAVIQRFDTPESLFYIDPPYPADTRNAKWSKRAYNHELFALDHVYLADCLKRIKGMAIISTYPNPLYDELFSTWHKVTTTAQTMAKSVATEALYLNAAAVERRLGPPDSQIEDLEPALES